MLNRWELRYYTEGILEFLATDQSKYKIQTGV